MKIKAVHVLDSATDCWYLVVKPEVIEKPMLDWVGWNMVYPQGKWNEITGPTLIIKPRANTTYCAMSHFDYPQADLEDRGNIDVDHTSVSLALAVRNIPFEEILDEYDFTNVRI